MRRGYCRARRSKRDSVAYSHCDAGGRVTRRSGGALRKKRSGRARLALELPPHTQPTHYTWVRHDLIAGRQFTAVHRPAQFCSVPTRLHRPHRLIPFARVAVDRHRVSARRVRKYNEQVACQCRPDDGSRSPKRNADGEVPRHEAPKSPVLVVRRGNAPNSQASHAYFYRLCKAGFTRLARQRSPVGFGSLPSLGNPHWVLVRWSGIARLLAGNLRQK